MSELRFRSCLVGTVLLLLVVYGVGPAHAENGASGDTAQKRTPLRTDFLGAAYVPGLDRIVVTGAHGLIGMLEIGETEAQLTVVPDAPDEDFTALAKFTDDEVLIGSSTGRLYRFDGETVTEIAALSEYDEPILAIAAGEAGVWIGGGRGLLARSADGEEFNVLDIRESIVTQPLAAFPDAYPADWYMGVGNFTDETLNFTAFRDGEPAQDPRDYEIHTDDGIVEIAEELDMEPPPTITFQFQPGPAYRGGDVSWNAIVMSGKKVTITGEFGMILQTEDDGATWTRRDIEMVPHEPEPPYWMAGVQKSDEIWLTGAGGVSQVSHDGGETWTDNPSSGREGIFGVTLMNDNVAVIAGAVGVIGTLIDDEWHLADRTRLQLLSWLRSPIVMPDGSVVVTGGRATTIRYRDGEWTRVPVNF